MRSFYLKLGHASPMPSGIAKPEADCLLVSVGHGRPRGSVCTTMKGHSRSWDYRILEVLEENLLSIRPRI